MPQCHLWMGADLPGTAHRKNTMILTQIAILCHLSNTIRRRNNPTEAFAKAVYSPQRVPAHIWYKITLSIWAGLVSFSTCANPDSLSFLKLAGTD